jgi:hypothetical protein
MRGIMSRLTRIVALTTVVAAMAFAPAAFAQSPSVDVYGGKGGEAVGALNNNDGGGPGTTSGVGASAGGGGGALPFTGLDVALLVGGGLLLIAVGAGLARLRPHGEVS